MLRLLDDISNSKSCGPDNISRILLKTFKEYIATSLTSIFAYSLKSGSLPSIWKEAKVIAIRKKNSRHFSNNYQPITLTCILCKLLEHISNHIHKYLDQNNLLSQSLHGFRSGKSGSWFILLMTLRITKNKIL